MTEKWYQVHYFLKSTYYHTPDLQYKNHKSYIWLNLDIMSLSALRISLQKILKEETR